MAKQSLADQIFGILAGHPEIKKIQINKLVCGSTKRRVKIVRSAAPKLLFSVTEPGHPRSEFEVETENVSLTANRVEKYLRRERIDVLNK